MQDKDFQFVVSVVRAEDGVRWNVKLGLDLLGQVVEEARGSWRAFHDEEGPGSLHESRMSAALELVRHFFKGEAYEDGDEFEDEATTLRYRDAVTGRRIDLPRSKFQCSSCHEWVPGSQVGMRRINDLSYRSQAQCSKCRSRKPV